MERTIVSFLCKTITVVCVIAVGVFGQSGEYWKISGDGTLTISSNMLDYRHDKVSWAGNSYLQDTCNAPWFPYRNRVTKVKFDAPIKFIGNYAFYACSLLTSIEIPSSVTTIGSDAFSDCKSLTSIEIPSSVTTIYDYAFYGCKSLTSIKIPSSVTTIGSSAFWNCRGLKSVFIGNSVESIGSRLFRECSIELVEISKFCRVY